jgi:tellurite resistance protein
MIAAGTIVRRHPHFQKLTPTAIKQMVHTQARILSADGDRALNGLAVILAGRRERMEAFDIAIKIGIADSVVGAAERKMLATIRKILGLDGNDREP